MLSKIWTNTLNTLDFHFMWYKHRLFNLEYEVLMGDDCEDIIHQRLKGLQECRCAAVRSMCVSLSRSAGLSCCIPRSRPLTSVWWVCAGVAVCVPSAASAALWDRRLPIWPCPASARVWPRPSSRSRSSVIRENCSADETGRLQPVNHTHWPRESWVQPVCCG